MIDKLTEDRNDWEDIVLNAFRSGSIGRKGLPNDSLNQLLFLPVHLSQRAKPLASLPQVRYSHDNQR